MIRNILAGGLVLLLAGCERCSDNKKSINQTMSVEGPGGIPTIVSMPLEISSITNEVQKRYGCSGVGLSSSPEIARSLASSDYLSTCTEIPARETDIEGLRSISAKVTGMDFKAYANAEGSVYVVVAYCPKGCQIIEIPPDQVLQQAR